MLTRSTVYDISPLCVNLRSLEVLFIDSVPLTKTSFIQTLKYHFRILDASTSRSRSRSASAYLTIRDFLDPEYQQICEGKPLKIFVRCATWDEVGRLLSR